MNLDISGKTAVVSGRTQLRVDDALANLRRAVPAATASGHAADLATATGAAALVAAVPHADILVNNLGIFEPRAFEDIDDADWMRFFESNVLSGVRLTRAYLAGSGIAESLVATGITVNTVLPGPTKSEGVAAVVKQMAERQKVDEAKMERRFFATARPSSLLKRFVTPDEVASLIVYLCTPAAAGTTGAALRVDGGVVRAIP